MLSGSMPKVDERLDSLWERRFRDLPVDCFQAVGGREDIEEFREWSHRDTTEGQLRIEAYLHDLDLTGRSILHVGIGNSRFALRFAYRARTIVGWTRSHQELDLARSLGLSNYHPSVHNKYGDSPAGCFDFIIDNNPTSFACCRRHLGGMMSMYAALLAPGGMLLSDCDGLAWVAGGEHANPRWSFDFEDWQALAGVFGLKATPLNPWTYALSFPEADLAATHARVRHAGSPFVIFSASRSGSSVLCAAFNAVPGVHVAYEPVFHDFEPTPDDVKLRVGDVLESNSGFKHVYDTTGFPFRDVGYAPIAEMERERNRWIELNLAILNYPGARVIFLRRRNHFARIVSELVGRWTQEWGYGANAFAPGGSERYHRKIAALDMPPLDEDLVGWYLENLPAIEEQLRSGIVNPVLDVYYEDLFAENVSLPERMEGIARILQFAKVQAPRNFFDSAELACLLAPSAKLNGPSILERIPNYRSLCSREPGSPRPVTPDGLIHPSRWRLRFEGDNLVRLTFPSTAQDQVRVIIERAATDRTYDIQLNARYVNLRANRTYVLRFLARADSERAISVGAAQSYEPWLGVGLYETLAVTPEWREFEVTFTASASESDARIHFDLGCSAVSVDLRRICLLEQSA